MRRLAIGGGVALVGILGLALFSWLRTKGLAVVLGPERFGVYGQLATFAAYAGAIASLGIGIGTTKLVAVERERRRGDEVATVLATSVALAASAGLLLAAAVLAAAPAIAPVLIDSDDAVLIALVALSIPFVAVQAPLQHTLQGFEDARGQARIYLVYGAVFAALSLTGAVLWGTTGAVVALAGGNVVLAGLYLARSRTLAQSLGAPLRLGRHIRGRLRRPTARVLLSIGAASLLLLTLGYGADLLVRTILLHDSGDEAAGIWYGLTLISIQFVAPLGAAMTYLTAPTIARAATRGDTEEVRRVLDDSLRLGLATVVPAIALILALRNVIVPLLFTHDFDAMTRYMPIQLTGDAVSILGWTLGAALVPLGFTRAWLAIGAGSSIVFGTVGVLLTLRFGVGGAAAAWAFQWLVELAATGGFLVRRRVWRPSLTVVGGVAANAVIFGGAILAPRPSAWLAMATGLTLLLLISLRGATRRSLRDLIT